LDFESFVYIYKVKNLFFYFSKNKKIFVYNLKRSYLLFFNFFFNKEGAIIIGKTNTPQMPIVSKEISKRDRLIVAHAIFP
jgi:hypothetical protein